MLKKYLLIIFAVIIIVFSFVMPNLLLRIEDLSQEKEIFSRAKKESKIDVQAQKIYLVRFIHDIYEIQNEKEVYYGDKKTVSVSKLPMTEHIEREVPREEVKNEIQKLVTNEIINAINIDEFENYTEVENIFSLEHTVVSVSLTKGKEEWIGIRIEEKTGKIICIDLPKEFFRNDVDREKQLQNYAKYLDLDIIDDWKYENQFLKSEKAQLVIFLEENEGAGILSIAPIEIYEEYVKEDTINHEYEIVESEKKKIKK